MARSFMSNSTNTIDVLIEPSERNNKAWEIAFWIVMVALVVITLLLRFLSFSTVSGDSMLNTVHDQDIAICAPAWGLERGDIVTAKVNDDKIIIKRVVAAPGDKIIFRLVDGAEGEAEKVVEIYVDKGGGFERLREDYIFGGVMNVSGFTSQAMFRQYVYRLFNGDMDDLSDKYVVSLGEDEYFLLGDNRDNSSDSRTYGAFKKEQIIGKVIKITSKGSTLFWIIDHLLFN
ncbi:MAG: signal peptidase I [Clostridia bacterium]|nr:signal peptidase I [Clostridia bacterium]